MKIRPYIEKLENSSEYKDFVSKNPEAYLVAGFFVLDLESGKNIHQIDFYLPHEKKVAAFTLDNQPQLQVMELLNDKIPEELNLDTNVDLDALEGILLDEMRNRGMSENIKKIIAVIQNIDGKKIWNLNCVLSGMEILKAHVEDKSQTVLKIERKSLLEIMQQLPTQKQQKPAQQNPQDIEKELENLKKLELEIEKEKEKLKMDLEKRKPQAP